MKKSFALVLTFIAILTCFAGCKAKKEKPNTVGNFAGINVAAVTKDNGGVIRDDAGNIVVYVTDAEGAIVKDKDGEAVTKSQAVEHAIVTGNRIEMPDYAINIPKGWSDSMSLDDLHIKKDGTEDQISISAMRNEKLEKVQEDCSVFFKFFPGGATTNKSMKIAGEDANFISAYTTVNGTGVYLGFITFSHQGVVYRCRFDSNRDLTGEIDNMVKILNTIEFVH